MRIDARREAIVEPGLRGLVGWGLWKGYGWLVTKAVYQASTHLASGQSGIVSETRMPRRT